MRIEVSINQKNRLLEVEPTDMLAEVLRREGFFSVRKGCDTTSCGLCTVWVDGSPVLSCSFPAFRAEGKQVITLEGVQQEAEAFAAFLIAEGADQCGFCSPGFIMTVLAMKRELKSPTEEDIVHYLTGNLCRCTGYMGQMRAVKKFMGVGSR